MGYTDADSIPARFTPFQCDPFGSISFHSDPIWKQFKPTAVDEIYQCVTCNKLLKAVNQSKASLRTHADMHTKEQRMRQQNDTKKWLVSGMISVLNIPINNFKHGIVRSMFALMNMQPIDDAIARRFTDEEAR